MWLYRKRLSAVIKTVRLHTGWGTIQPALPRAFAGGLRKTCLIYAHRDSGL